MHRGDSVWRDTNVTLLKEFSGSNSTHGYKHFVPSGLVPLCLALWFLLIHA